MARQLRIEFEGAYYHILSRGNNQSDLFHSDEDRQDFLYILADMSERSGGRSLVYKFLPLLDRIDLSQIILWNLTEQAGFTGFFFAFSVSE